MPIQSSEIEIMSPAGSRESMLAAIQGGAGSVYFGVGNLNMRAGSARNFTISDLPEIATLCRRMKVKSYLTLNTVMYDDEMQELKEIISVSKQAGIDAIIASDPAVIQYVSSQNMEIHISTQCNISNIESVKFYSKFADVMVLARELNLQQIKAITSAIDHKNITGPSGKQIRIELFAHGALCMAISGKCYLSLDNLNASANRGKCLQVCRRPYHLREIDGNIDLEIDQKYIMSPKDLCTIGILDQILSAGVKILKIEGRGRSPEYVKTVTSSYKEAVLAIENQTYDADLTDRLTKKLNSVYNRGFWEGYYLGRKMGEWSDSYGSHSSHKKVYSGKVTNYFPRLGVAEILIENENLTLGDTIQIHGPSTGVYEGEVTELRNDDGIVNSAGKGIKCSFPVTKLVRRNDKLYLIKTVDKHIQQGK